MRQRSQPRAGLVTMVLLVTVLALGAQAQLLNQAAGASQEEALLNNSIKASTSNLDRLSHMTISASSTDSFSISKYLVQGVVLDDQGAPVEGAALHIGRLIAYTDSRGRFMLRFQKRGSFPLSLAWEEFLKSGVYQVVSAPSEVRAEPEESAADVRVVVRRIPPPQARLYNR